MLGDRHFKFYELRDNLLRPEEAAKLLGVGRTKVYALIRCGSLRSVRIDGLRRIPATALAEFVAQLEQEQAA